jgi:hypothetical protein
MKAKRRDDMINVVRLDVLPDCSCAMVDCADYAAFKALPAGIEIDGQLFGQSGWNSDRCLAYYRNDWPARALAKRIG